MEGNKLQFKLISPRDEATKDISDKKQKVEKQ